MKKKIAHGPGIHMYILIHSPINLHYVLRYFIKEIIELIVLMKSRMHDLLFRLYKRENEIWLNLLKSVYSKYCILRALEKMWYWFIHQDWVLHNKQCHYSLVHLNSSLMEVLESKEQNKAEQKQRFQMLNSKSI